MDVLKLASKTVHSKVLESSNYLTIQSFWVGNFIAEILEQRIWCSVITWTSMGKITWVELLAQEEYKWALCEGLLQVCRACLYSKFSWIILQMNRLWKLRCNFWVLKRFRENLWWYLSLEWYLSLLCNWLLMCLSHNTVFLLQFLFKRVFFKNYETVDLCEFSQVFLHCGH